MIKTLIMVVLPALLFLGLNRFYLNAWVEQERSIRAAEMARLLGNIAGLSEPQQRFDQVFRRLSEIPFPSETFNTRLKQIFKDNPNTFEIFFFDDSGKCFDLDFLPKPPRFVAQKFFAAVKNPEKATRDEKWLLQFSGYKNAHLAISANPESIVKIGRSDDRQWGGIFSLENADHSKNAEFIVFIRKSALDTDQLMTQAVHNANSRLSRNYTFAWYDPLKPGKIFPESINLDSDLVVKLETLPYGQSEFDFKNRQILKSFTDSGMVLLAITANPVEPGSLSLYIELTIKTFALLAFIVILPLNLGVTSIKPGLRAKITSVLLLGSVSCMLSLIFSGLIDRSDREKVLTSQYQQDNISELRRIDEGLIFEFKRIEQLISSRMRKIEGLEPEDFSMETRNFWRHLQAFSDRFKELVIVSSETTLLFNRNSEKPVKSGEESTAAMYGDMILQTYQGRYVTPSHDAQAHSLKEVIHNSTSAFSRNFILKGGQFENLSLADSTVPTYIDFFIDRNHQGRAILMAFISRSGIQRNYLLAVSRFFDEKRDPLQPRMAALPIVASLEWPAFPKRKSAENEVLREISLKVISSALPVHQKAVINNRTYLLSAAKGKYLDGYVLILARPYEAIAGKISDLNRKMLMMAVIIILLAAFVAWLTSRLLLHPIRKIGKVLGEIAAGNFRVSLQPEIVAEFDAVSASLNRTIESFHEIKVASNIQEHLWPEKSISGPDWQIQGLCQTATELGGDHYDWLQLSDGRILMTIGDVTGHGIGAAMVQASVKVWVALKGLNCRNSAELLGEINRLHCTYGAKKLPMSFWAGYYHPGSGRLDYASAGQSYPLVVDPSGSVTALKQPGMPLGIRIKNQYQMNEIVLTPGQKLVLYTDGIVETTDRSGKMLGFAGLENLVSSLARVHAGQLISQIFSAARNWGEQNDDRTVVILSRSDQGDADAA